jgi:hypothetical protein
VSALSVVGRTRRYQTTQKHYINPTSQMQDAVSQMPIPAALKREQTTETDEQEGDGKK